MKSIIFFTILFIQVKGFCQNSKQIEAKFQEIQKYLAVNFEDEIWLEYNSCDLNSVSIFIGNRQYSFQLTSLKDAVMFDDQASEGKDVKSKMKLRTFKAAKIKLEKSESGYEAIDDGEGIITWSNGISFQDDLTLRGDLEYLENVCVMFSELIRLRKSSSANESSSD